jgi:hypothetical protein
MFGQQSEYEQQSNKTKNGQVHVDYIPPKSKTSTDHVGEYVDYEELN